MFSRKPKVDVIPLDLVCKKLMTLIATAGVGMPHAPDVTWIPNQNVKIMELMHFFESRARKVHLKDSTDEMERTSSSRSDLD